MKNTLFRFTTTRNYQRISEDDKRSYYIEASNTIKNQMHFLQGLTPGSTYYQLIQAIVNKEMDFNGRRRISELRSYKRGLIYEVSLILRNRKNFEKLIEELNEKIGLDDKNDYTFSEDEEIVMWDNLIYSLLIKKSKPDVDAIISLLVTNNFLYKFNLGANLIRSLKVENNSSFERLLNAKIVLPLDIKLPALGRRQNNTLSSQQKEVLLEKQELIITKQSVEDLKQLDLDIKELIALKDFKTIPISLFPTTEISFKNDISKTGKNGLKVDWVDTNRSLEGFVNLIKNNFQDADKAASKKISYFPSGIDETFSPVEQPEEPLDIIDQLAGGDITNPGGPRPSSIDETFSSIGQPEEPLDIIDRLAGGEITNPGSPRPSDIDETFSPVEQPEESLDVIDQLASGDTINPGNLGLSEIDESVSSLNQDSLFSDISTQSNDDDTANSGNLDQVQSSINQSFSSIEQSQELLKSKNQNYHEDNFNPEIRYYSTMALHESDTNLTDGNNKQESKEKWDETTVFQNLNARSQKTFKNSNYTFDSLEKLEISVAKDINLKLTNAYSKLKLNSTRALINGVRLDIKIVPIDNSYVISTRPNSPSHFDIYLTQYFTDSENAVAEIEGEVIFGNDSSKLLLEGTEIIHSFSNYVTFKLNQDPIERISNKTQVDQLNLRYRTRRDLFTDLEEVIDRIRLKYPYYGLLKVTPERVLPERSPLYGLTDLGIIDFRRVEQEVLCYEPGEVSHIENIMASEYKEKTSRTYVSTEVTEESESTSESERITDNISTERLEMQSEVSEVLSSENSKDFSLGTGVSGSNFGVTFNVDSDISLSSSDSKEESTRRAINKAKEITSQVKERILTKVTRRRSYKLLREYEETNKHGYDNRLNEKHVVGIYRWLDKIIENKLVNYGTRLTYQFFIGEPAKSFKESLVIQSQDSGSESNPALTMLTFKKPRNPIDILGKNFQKVSPEELYIAASKYGVKLDKLPDPQKYVSRSFAMVIREEGEEWKTDDAHAYNDEFLIPDNYYCDGFKLRAVAGVHGDDERDKWASVIVGDKEIPVLTRVSWTEKGVTKYKHYLKVNKTATIPKTEGSLAVSYITNDIGSLSFNVLARCKLKPEVLNKWKNDAFQALISAYERKLQEYEDKMRSNAAVSAEPEQPQTRAFNYNPFINRKIERTELKRMCIEMMIQSFDEFIISGDSYKPGETALNLTKEYDTRAKRINFLEEAFDWDLMAYKFFPYFYVQKDKWYEMMHIDGTNDEIFKSFLSSGMAKVKLPVKRGHENAVQFFLRTGEIWFGSGFVLDSEDDLDISINEEIDNGQREIEIEDTWMTRLPTTLTIVQDKGNSLFGEGLPCRNSEGNLAKGESLLQGVEKKKLEG